MCPAGLPMSEPRIRKNPSTDVRSKFGQKIELTQAIYHVVGNSFLGRLLPYQGRQNVKSEIEVNWYW